jgi:hypothetical protein
VNFVDTNLLVYARASSASFRDRSRARSGPGTVLEEAKAPDECLSIRACLGEGQSLSQV